MDFDPVASSHGTLKLYVDGILPLNAAWQQLNATLNSHDLPKDIVDTIYWMEELLGLTELRTPEQLCNSEQKLRNSIVKIMAR